MLTVTGGINAALSADTLRYAWLLQLGDDLFYTNHTVDIDFGGNSYKSQGDILSLPSVVRERRIKLQSYTVTFSNVDVVMAYNLRYKYEPDLPGFVPYDRVGDACEVRLVFLDAAGAVIDGQAISLYKGAFDSWTEQDSGSRSTISLKITSPWAKPNLTAGRATSDHNQKDNYPGDQFFQFAHEEKNTIGWGADA